MAQWYGFRLACRMSRVHLWHLQLKDQVVGDVKDPCLRPRRAVVSQTILISMVCFRRRQFTGVGHRCAPPVQMVLNMYSALNTYSILPSSF